jgi:hypothetical protein
MKAGWQQRQDWRDFQAAKEIVERVHQRLGIDRTYSFREWRRDEQFLEGSAKRKRLLRAREAEGLRAFIRWQALQTERNPHRKGIFEADQVRESA